MTPIDLKVINLQNPILYAAYMRGFQAAEMETARRVAAPVTIQEENITPPPAVNDSNEGQTAENRQSAPAQGGQDDVSRP